MSQIYGSLYQGLEPKRFKGGSTPNPLLLALGTAWEKHLEFLVGNAGIEVLRPGELVTPEGIAYSPDGIIEDEYRLVEYKLSSMGTKDLPTRSTSSFPSKFDKYTCQMMSYCYHLETPRARLYFASTYKPHDPVMLVYDIEFTPRELRDNWAAMVNHAHHTGLLK